MELQTVGNGIYALSTTLVLAYTIAVIKFAKPMSDGGSNIFDQEWLEHGFCVINQDIPYMNSHDLCLYVDTVLVALGLLMHHKLKGKIDHQAMKSSDDLLLFNMLGHLGHGIAHGFIGAEFRKEGFEGAQHGTYMERAERGDEGSMIEMMIKAIALFGFWCGLLKGVAPSLPMKQLMLLSLLVGYVHLHVPSILIFGYVNAVLTVLNTYVQLNLPSEMKEYSYVAYSLVSLVLSIIPWIEATACQSIASKLGGHLIFDVAIPIGVMVAYLSSFRHYSLKDKGAKSL